MRKRNTCRCHYCYATGHNKRTCPSLKEYVKNNPTSHTAENFKYKQANAKIRSCSYCANRGHNKSTCDKLSNDRIGAILRNKEFRFETLKNFNRLGIGLGTLFRRKAPKWDVEGKDSILMCEEIQWDNILSDNSSRHCILVNNCCERDWNNDMSINSYFYKMIENGDLIIEVPASPDNIGVGIPENWACGVSNIKAIFNY